MQYAKETHLKWLKFSTIFPTKRVRTVKRSSQ